MEEGSQKVQYDTKSHFQVLTQMHGSVWPRVLPHCLLNVLNASVIVLLDRHYGMDISYSDKGHTFMSMIVSFLIVTRSNIAYARFMESRSHLSTSMRSCRELMQYAVTFTRYDISDNASKWRFAIARKLIVLLRSVVGVLEFESTGEHVWKNKVLTDKEKKAVTDAVGEDNFRTPMVLAMFLRTAIASNFDFLDAPMHVNRELKLFSFLSDFVKGYHGLTKLIDTQFPFPLLQMTRTFVFFWVYTLPAVLYNDKIEVEFLILIVFFITYAFVGLECVSIELDDPFGTDPNDFDVLGLARVVFQDIYICIYDVDGAEKAQKLKKFFEVKASNKSRPKHERTLSIYRELWTTGQVRSGYTDGFANDSDDDSDSNYEYNAEAGNHNSNFMKKADETMQTFSARSSMRSSIQTLKGTASASVVPTNRYTYGATAGYGSDDALYKAREKNGTSDRNRNQCHPLLNP